MPVSAAVQQALTSDIPDAEFAQRIASGDHLAFEPAQPACNHEVQHQEKVALQSDGDALAQPAQGQDFPVFD